MNPMTQYPPRPTVTEELVKSAVRELINKTPEFSESLGEENANEIAGEYRLGMDGFELCKKLEKWCGWDTTREDMEALDGLDYIVRQHLIEAERQWLKDNNIQPPFPIGSHVKCMLRMQTGVIDEVFEHSPGCYLVVPDSRTEEEIKSRMRWVCKFEKVELVDKEPA